MVLPTYLITSRFSITMLAQLIPTNGGPRITLTQQVTLVGRSPQLCDLSLDHSSVSKLHCVLVKTDGLVYMRDLGSTNGTRVNGQRVLRGALLPGDRISFGGTGFRIHLGPDPRLSAGTVPNTVSQSDRTEMLAVPELPPDDDSTSNSDVRLLSDSDFTASDN